MGRLEFREIELSSKFFYSILLILGGVLLTAAYAFAYIESHGHFVTGMNNQVVWGLPHVVAIFLIISAAGVVNIASLGSVFNQPDYLPYGRLALVSAVSLLLGGLLVILLDLGHADRLVIAMTYFNVDSVFAWNLLRYSGFFVIMSLYLWSMMDRTVIAKRCYKPLAYLGLIWPLIMMVGAGAIFGELVARGFYDTLVMAPLFIALSYLFGTACFSLVLLLVYKLEGRALSELIQNRLAKKLCVFISAVVLIELVRHLLNYFVNGNTAIEIFILRDAGVVTIVFWFGQLLVGAVLPLVVLYYSRIKKYRLVMASLLVTLGGLCQLYVIIIAGQLQPMRLFPDAVSENNGSLFNSYSVSLPEVVLSIGGVAFVLFIFTISAKVLCITPSDSQ